MYESEYVYQTYTYSAENHYYTPHGLIPICERAVCGDLDVEFCFESFTEELSKIIHMPFCYILFLRKNGEHKKYKSHYSSLKGIIRKRFGGNINIAKIDEILSSFCNDISQLNDAIDKNTYISSTEELGEFYKTLSNKGLVDKNTFFLKGHDLEDIVLSPLCNSVAKRIILNKIKTITINNSNKKMWQS